jgi:LAO/AO transport system kinase
MFVRNLRLMLAPSFSRKTEEVAVIKTVAARKEGITDLAEKIEQLLKTAGINEKTSWLLAEKAYYLIGRKRMKDIDKVRLKAEIEKALQQGNFNLYQYIADK